ncbi:hypothetical protein CTZ28_43695 [Streptomyces shenzhenensis]|uniref:Uncharacterized protein n=1 Tax=Streptomyces shenzhenensis TaxID=943815 RepID=A0A3M0HUD2_9ACTN|nr:hypothetical protein CTZ28_43695 [Streptomyces shenzhenensis]
MPTPIDLPARPEPPVSDDGSLLATAAVRRIRATRPDLIVRNGDITDRGLPQALAPARQVRRLPANGARSHPASVAPGSSCSPAPSGRCAGRRGTSSR